MTPPLFVLLCWNILVFAVYGIDKLCAKVKTSRVPERALLLLAFLMGGAGAAAGMLIFRHKTRKPLFTVGVPLALIANIAAVCTAVYCIYN